MGFSLEIKHEDEYVVGNVIPRSERDITVEIISPYDGLTNSLHIPYFVYMGQSGYPYYFENGEITDHGQETAERLLRELYAIGKSIHGERSALKETFKQYNQDLLELNLLIVLCKKKLRKLRQEFKKGDYGQKQYQSELQETRNRIEGYEFQIHQLFKHHFAIFFDNVVGGGTREDVINYISKLD